MNKKLRQRLACPVCKGPLEPLKKTNELVCKRDGLAYPIRSGIAVLLQVDARKLEPALTTDQK